ncbi:aldo/keto reductase [Arthrobacter sp. LAPM80]|uniref:aldo/keto reductase n=1 Tax=Arthrobacter sp. LAPM80 TaxID=3141788 RepID=UPI00398A8AE4
MDRLPRFVPDPLARSIEASNFLPEQLEHVIALGGTVPAVNQVQTHPALQQRDIQAFDAKHGLFTEAWSPLVRGAVLDARPVLAAAHTLGRTPARPHARTPAQVVRRWQLQQGRKIIPQSVTPSRIAENLDILDLELSDAELAWIDALENDGRTVPPPSTANPVGRTPKRSSAGEISPADDRFGVPGRHGASSETSVWLGWRRERTPGAPWPQP